YIYIYIYIYIVCHVLSVNVMYYSGESVNFTCFFPKESRSTVAWVKQRAGEKTLLIASSYQALPAVFENYFDKHNRFFVEKDDSRFNLSITNVKESDTATYYCVKYIYQFTFGESTDLIVKGKQNDYLNFTVVHVL
uniref:Ig-like domain-containing protein n=1 Tax=Cyprinus carpio TaxID=7962 RepID=A0A8C1LRI4_CYPCA